MLEMWENPISHRVKYALIEKLQSVRNRHYAGLLDYDTAVQRVKQLCCEFCGDTVLENGELRRLSAGAMAVAYLAPEVDPEHEKID